MASDAGLRLKRAIGATVNNNWKVLFLSLPVQFRSSQTRVDIFRSRDFLEDKVKAFTSPCGEWISF